MAEAGFIALKEVIFQVSWLQVLMKHMEVTLQGPTPIYTDSKAALDMVKHFGQAKATRNACVTFAVVREAVESKQVVLCKVASEHNVADMFTKALVGPKLRELSAKLGLELSLSSSSFSSLSHSE